MGKVQKAALFYILAMAIFFYGYAVARFAVPPHAFLESRVQEIRAFAAGDALDKDTTLIEKLQSDVGLIPKRFLGAAPKGIDGEPLIVPGLKSRR